MAQEEKKDGEKIFTFARSFFPFEGEEISNKSLGN